MFSSGLFLLICLATGVSAEDATDPTERPITAPEDTDADKFLGNCGNQRIIKTAHGLLLQATGPEWKVDQSKELPPKLSTYWTVEIRGEMVVLMASGSPGRALRANPDSSIDLAADAKQEGVEWKPVANDDGSFSLQSAYGKWLTVNPQAWNTLSTHDNRYAWEHFWIRSTKDCADPKSNLNLAKIVQGHWSIISAQHMYLDNQNGESVKFVAEKSEWLAHWLIEARGDKVVLRSLTGAFLRTGSTPSVELGKDAQEWTPFKNEDGTWSFQSEAGTFLSAGKNGTVLTDKHHFSMQKFWLEEW